MLTDSTMLVIAATVSRWFELAGIAVIIAGSVVAVWLALRAYARTGADDGEATHRETRGEGPVPVFRKALGRAILTGLELLVAADIIRTVAVEPTLENVAVLGAIVLIRTILSLSLEIEIEGQWPWNRARRAKERQAQGKNNPNG